MNILVIGSGGREYAIIKSLLKSNQKIDIYGMGDYSNPGILRMVKGFRVMEEFNTIDFLSFVKNINPRFVVIGPEKYLNLKLPEILYNENIPCIGPMGIMAKIETSKIFCRHFLNDNLYGNFSPEYLEINSKYSEKDLYEIFEKINNNKVMFTIANLYEPGYFKDALNIKGLTFFFITSNPIDSKKTLSIMFRLANKINRKINGKIYSEQGKILNEMNYQEMLGQHNTQN